jgi:hypothetical protein
MTDWSASEATGEAPTYLERGDPAGRFAGYYPAWVDKRASDVTLEGSMLDGALQGADAIRAVIGGVRELYDRQDFSFAGSWGDSSFIEDQHRRGSRQVGRALPRGQLQRRRAGTAHRGALPTAELR